MLSLEIVTPEARVYSDTIDTVVVPTTDGDIGILPGHIPLMASIQHGELIVSKGGTTQYLAVGGGFVQVSEDKVSVLAESAITEEKIDEHAVEAAMKRAEADLRNAATEPAEVERLEGFVRFAVAQLALKRRRR